MTPEEIANGLVGLIYTEALAERLTGREYAQHIANELRAYGDERAREMREQCWQVAYRRAEHGSYDASEIAERVARLPLSPARPDEHRDNDEQHADSQEG